VTNVSAEEWISQGVPNSIFISKTFAVAGLVIAVGKLVNVGTPPTAQGCAL
jgi:hypothetical protein